MNLQGSNSMPPITADQIAPEQAPSSTIFNALGDSSDVATVHKSAVLPLRYNRINERSLENFGIIAISTD